MRRSTKRFVEWVPERIVAWAAYSAQFWDDPAPSEHTPPGIVACGELDGSRWFPSYSYFFKGRELGKPWTWVSIPETGHRRKGPFEQFVRDFFASICRGSDRCFYADVDTGESFERANDAMHQELLTVLPTENLIKAWQKLRAYKPRTKEER